MPILAGLFPANIVFSPGIAIKVAIDSTATATNDIKITRTLFNAVGDFVSTVCKGLALLTRANYI
jgi:hypothetical protein